MNRFLCLQVLKVREDHVGSVLDEARFRLGEVTKDQSKYREILLTLIIQGLYQIMEPQTLVKCRKQDVGMVEELLPRAAEEYKKMMGLDVSLKLETESFIPPDACGGVQLSALHARIRVSSVYFFNYKNKNIFFFSRFLIHWNHVLN